MGRGNKERRREKEIGGEREMRREKEIGEKMGRGKEMGRER